MNAKIFTKSDLDAFRNEHFESLTDEQRRQFLHGDWRFVEPKHNFKIGDNGFRKNHNYPDEPQQWIEFVVNETYLKLIEEFPNDYRMARKYGNIVEEMGFIVKVIPNNAENPTITVYSRIDYFSSFGELLEEYDLFIGEFSTFEYAVDLIRERGLKPYEKVVLSNDKFITLGINPS